MTHLPGWFLLIFGTVILLAARPEPGMEVATLIVGAVFVVVGAILALFAAVVED